MLQARSSPNERSASALLTMGRFKWILAPEFRRVDFGVGVVRHSRQETSEKKRGTSHAPQRQFGSVVLTRYAHPNACDYHENQTSCAEGGVGEDFFTPPSPPRRAHGPAPEESSLWLITIVSRSNMRAVGKQQVSSNLYPSCQIYALQTLPEIAPLSTPPQYLVVLTNASCRRDLLTNSIQTCLVSMAEIVPDIIGHNGRRQTRQNAKWGLCGQKVGCPWHCTTRRRY